MKIINSFLIIKDYHVKGHDICPNIFLKTAFYGLDMKPELEPEP